ncbi:hypothetical protein [Limosilactobacillus caecicola]|uniref:hypothetical protein n=1 Tax=Limosilactobacillus caecicola TaxID=2941332 RepID=UPI00203DA8EA|nr:hypothetical protein [Limosilactobacillus caecicola]
MTTPVDQANWQSAIHFVINRALPSDDYQVVCFHQSKSSESVYVDVLLENFLFQLRFSFHDHQEKNPDLYSFNLRAFPHDHALIPAVRQILSRRSQGLRLTYDHFAGLSLVEKWGQFEDSPLHRHDDLFWENQQPLLTKNGATQQLEFLWQHQLLVIKHTTNQVFLSESGEHLLDYYWDVADQYLEDDVWDDNPRTKTPNELKNLLLI